MKKNILIFCAILIAFSLTTLGIIKTSDTETETTTEVKDIVLLNSPKIKKVEQPIFTDFIYDVSPRFEPISKTDLLKATSISDFITPESFNSIVNLDSVSIVIIKNDRQTEIREVGYTKDLTSGQLKLLKAFDYSTHFNIRSEFTAKNAKTGLLEHTFDSPHLSVVPEKQAEYMKGKQALIDFLKEKSKKIIAEEQVNPKKLKPAKLYFTITTKGTIKNVRLDRTSNYPEIDKFMIELIQKTPDVWLPAENIKGEKLDQELVVSFGLMGC